MISEKIIYKDIMNRWNAFRRQYGGLGLSQRELSLAYRGQQRGGEPDPVDEFLASASGHRSVQLVIYYQGGIETRYAKLGPMNYVTVQEDLANARPDGFTITIGLNKGDINSSIYNAGQPVRWELSELEYGITPPFDITYHKISEGEFTHRGSKTKSATKR